MANIMQCLKNGPDQPIRPSTIQSGSWLGTVLLSNRTRSFKSNNLLRTKWSIYASIGDYQTRPNSLKCVMIELNKDKKLGKLWKWSMSLINPFSF